jgi:FtsZ-binding cell division protein ZapB
MSIDEDNNGIMIITDNYQTEILATESIIPDNGAAYLRMYELEVGSTVAEWLSEVEAARLAFKLLEIVGVPAFDASEVEEVKREYYARGFDHGKEAADTEKDALIDELRIEVEGLSSDNDYLQSEADDAWAEAWSLRHEVDDLRDEVSRLQSGLI